MTFKKTKTRSTQKNIILIMYNKWNLELKWDYKMTVRVQAEDIFLIKKAHF